ncbi:hypothetical protein S83_063147, partial [Arachis hypogaea]
MRLSEKVNHYSSPSMSGPIPVTRFLPPYAIPRTTLLSLGCIWVCPEAPSVSKGSRSSRGVDIGRKSVAGNHNDVL